MKVAGIATAIPRSARGGSARDGPRISALAAREAIADELRAPAKRAPVFPQQMMSDSFALLETPRRPWVDPEELKESFHRLTLVAHPDRTGDSEASAELNAAYATLRDPASRLKHLLELEQPELLRQTREVPPALGEVFMRLATLRRAVEAFVEQRAHVSTPLAQALLASERFTLQRDLEKEIAAVEVVTARALDKLLQLDAYWPERATETYEHLAALHQELTYLGKWTWSLREALFRLETGASHA